ncbi:hypothetical protein CQW23_19250 [Capsicum baccatum]|uniref:Uncharacterized protein n=1 Tax=Capsicum baccatum TaxID=33114 RepID=A0A2G2W594_CAPBA|nr:hypothetical protein CQW23_19250 [Capsicum baccatum]
MLSEIQKLAQILPTYLNMSDFLDHKVRTDWLTIEAYRDKMGYGLFIFSKRRNCSLFVAIYTEYLSDELQVPNDVLVAGLLCQGYTALLLKYEEAKAQKLYTSDSKDP